MTAILAGAALAVTPTVAADRLPAGLTVDRAVLLMRHGVRPPTNAQPLPAAVTPETWPDWPTKPGWLTPHGAVAVGRVGSWDGARFRGLGLLPHTGCPAAGTIRVIADSDQRTIATADAWIAALAPGCHVASEHRPQDERDPIFSPIDESAPFDPARADAAVGAAIGRGGIAAVETPYRPLLARLDAVLCGSHKAGCGVRQEASGLISAKPGKRPKLTGALDRASTAAQILLLEYADGKPTPKVGWGRARAGDIAAFSAFHALEFRLLARPPYVAAANMGGIVPLIREGLTGSVRVTMLSGHDTNVASLGGLLDLHWTVPGLAMDDPAPGGAIVLERLRDRRGGLYVRALYRSQTLEQIRAAGPLANNPPYLAALPIPGCVALGVKGLCTLAAFEKKLDGPPSD
ncbi:MAG: histidine-type phosphatase [Sphingomonas sp.]|uniref:histidine-type phosphatase n=1 Tax=Sphingomonas sp. TaxID=28214 RepID=UPI00356A7273